MNRRAITRYYWWLVTQDEDGKPFLIFGSDKSENDALQNGREMLPGTTFEIRKLPTRNLQRASSLIKGNRLESTHSLKEASKRLGHEKSVERLRRKREKQSSSDWDPFNSY